ncbi:low-density lipoprotein receptor-related protein 1-like [Planococcus citri]|uniref:low-density lipoprotein receptor-related protein 1-like n=1 Tax=Planococcus citri TaxID=170843 RepID=UPI0031F9757F
MNIRNIGNVLLILGVVIEICCAESQNTIVSHDNDTTTVSHDNDTTTISPKPTVSHDNDTTTVSPNTTVPTNTTGSYCSNVPSSNKPANSIMTPSTGFPRKTFSCRDGRYVANEQFCDGVFNCDDKSDEPPHCTESHLQVCGTSGKFRCPNSTHPCIDADRISDTVVYDKYLKKENYKNMPQDILFNCTNENATCKVQFMHNDVRQCFNSSSNSSEKQKENNNEGKCSSYNETFLCNDTRRCLSWENVCDGDCNCLDCSDENETCSTVDHDMLAECRSYLPFVLRPKCLDNLNLSTPINNCSSDETCDQKCTLYKKRAMCSCNENYYRITDGENSFRCQHKDFEQDVIIYATSTELKYLSLTTRKSHELYLNPAEITALTATTDHLYYAIYSNGSAIITKYSFSSTNATEIEPYSRNPDSPITSMVVDHSGRNLYFIAKSTLMHYKPSNSSNAGFSFQNVSHVASAPNYGLMFYSYTKKNDPLIWSIIKYNMTASEEETLIEEIHSSIKFLVTDESIKRLYWLQANGCTLFSVPFNGDTSEIRTYEHLENVVSLTAHDSKVFYTKLNDGRIYTLQNRQNFTKSIRKSYYGRFNVFGYLNGSSQYHDGQPSVGYFITAKHLYVYRNKVLFNHAVNEFETKKSKPKPTPTPKTPFTTANTTVSTIITTTPKLNGSSTQPSQDHSPQEEGQKSEQEQKSGSSFWQIFSVIIILIVAAFGLYVWYNRRRNPYTSFNARTWFRSHYDHTNDYDQNEL